MGFETWQMFGLHFKFKCEICYFSVSSFINLEGYIILILEKSWADPEGGQGDGPPLKTHKNLGFLSNTGSDPLKITKLPSQYSMLGHHQPASETSFKWRFAGGLINGQLIVLFGSFLPS